MSAANARSLTRSLTRRPARSGTARLALVCAVAILAGGCAADTDDQPAAESAPAAAGEAPMTSAASTAEQDALLAEHRLSMDLVRRFTTAAENLQAVHLDDPALDEAHATDGDFQTIGELRTLYRANAAVRNAIENAGLSIDEFILTNATLFSAYMLVAMEEAGWGGSSRDTWVRDHHLDFVRANRAELDAVIARLQVLGEEDD